MRKITTTQSAFFYLRASIGLLLLSAGAFLALSGIGQFSAQAQQQNQSNNSKLAPAFAQFVPPMFDCSQMRALGIDKQENHRAGLLRIYCGEAQGGSPLGANGEMSIAQQVLGPLLGAADVNLITGTDSGTHITQSETFATANPDNPQEVVVAYNDSRDWGSFIDISGASWSTDGGNTFTRLTNAQGRSPFPNTLGDPVVLYNRPTGTWFTIWLDTACGGQGLGGFKTTDPTDVNGWTHFCIHNGFSDDRESGWTDHNPNSPFYGRMYVSFNDFGRGGGALFVRFSTDNGATWNNERQLSPGFFRDVQITGDAETGTLFVAGMNEGGGGLNNRINLMYRSTDGGASWTNTYTGPAFPAPGTTLCASNSYFACMFNGPSYWRHMGWGQPAALDGVVHYVYDSRNTGNGDTGNVFYIRSDDNGVTFSAPFQLNTDSTTRPQWQPNISVGAGGSLLAVWYDARESTNCVKGSTSTPCYRMWARRSTDNGLTWQPDEGLSDVVTPLPGQPDSGIVTEYAGDYDYSFASPTDHIHTWTDGRVAVNNASQQDAFVDRVAISGGGGGDITLTATKHRQNGRTKVSLHWDPADGGTMNVLRNGAVVGTTPDNGAVQDNLGQQTGTFIYQVCETDSGDCSNEVRVRVRPRE